MTPDGLLAAAVAGVVFVAGAGVVTGTVLSAVRTVVLPRGTAVLLSRVVFGSLRRLFDARARRARTYERRDDAMALYAPISLLTLPLVWLGLVLGGYTLMFWTAESRSWSDAFVTSGSSLLTLGYERPSNLAATALSFSEAALGIAVLALLLVTYLPSMYAAFSRREAQIALLEARAGSPPSGVEMIERYHRIDWLDRLTAVWEDWEAWFVDIEETHTSLPALAFFRSPQGEHSWVTAAGAVLDGAALRVSVVAGPRSPEAELCMRAGYVALRRIAEFFRIAYDEDPAPDDPIAVTRDEFDSVYGRLADAGVPVVADRDEAWRRFAGWRVNYDAVLIALAGLVMAPYAPWSSDRSTTLRPPRRMRAAFR
ncbi:MAG: hypothetical protein M3N17_03230 [Actinomycetota bacterium]|nr:hypothetical protein [Actinomycetota bacterium]